MQRKFSLGRIAFWVVWPVSWLSLRSSYRTRVLIHCRGQIVVVENWLGTGKWSLPGGGVRRREAPSAAARREVYEETGLLLDTAQLHALGELVYRDHGHRFRYQLFLIELPRRPALKPRPHEIRRAAWRPVKDLDASNAGTSVLQALEHWSP